MKVEFHKHNLGQAELNQIKKVLTSVFLTTGPATEKFEKEFAKYLKCKYVIGVNSCTAALHLSLLAHGIGKGDEIITTPLSFAATANAIEHVGAKPIFVDVLPETGNINPELIEKAITKKTKAIIPVHLYGQMADMKKIKRIANKHKLIIIEDAAHCVEGQRDKIRPAQLSDCACFSFHAIKTMTAGESGAVATNNKKIAEKIKELRNHGMNQNALKRYEQKYQPWDIKELGLKYNMSDIQAAILIPQIKNLEKRLSVRKKIANQYQKALRQMPNVETLKTQPKTKHALNSFTILVNEKKRGSVIYQLKKQGVGVIVNFYPIIPLLTYYRKRYGFQSGMFSQAEKISKKVISLPLYPRLTSQEINYIIKILKSVIS